VHEFSNNTDIKMKKLLKQTVVLSVGLIISCASFANEWTSDSVIDKIQTGSSGHVVVTLSSTETVNPAGCALGSGVLFLLKENTGYDTHMAFLLPAFHAGSVVTLNVSDASCYSGYREIVRVALKK